MANVMRQRWVLYYALLTTLLLGGQTPTTIQSDKLQEQLSDLTRRGFTYHMLDNDLIELTDPLSGEKHLKSLREPSEATIRAWAAQRGIPILEIDPNAIDTSQYTGWYTYWTEVPLSNGFGKPLVVSDVDRDGRADVYGGFRDFTSQDFGARVYEIDSTGTVELGYDYVPRPGVSRTVANVDEDLLTEVLWSLAGGVYDYEQVDQDSLPVHLRFVHERYQGNVSPGYTGIYVGSLDQDTLNDFLYKGSEPDSADTNYGVSKIYVAEYDHVSNNFLRVWSTTFVPGSQGGIAGFAVADFDVDGSMEFIASEIYGHVFLVENTGNNSFVQTWQDSTPYVNFYYQTTGDVDMDGKPEFFVGATMASGNWTTMYEADSNDHYSARFVFHLLSGGTLDEPVYLTTDVDGDGKLELVIFSGADLYVFKSNLDDAYQLWYYKREYNRDAVQFYDLNNDGKEDFLISKLEIDSLGRGRFYASVYKATGLVDVQEERNLPLRTELCQNYPNPFNPSTVIRFDLSGQGNVSLVVYDILGKSIAELASGTYEAGSHSATWNAQDVASGMYFARFTVMDSEGKMLYAKVNKLMLIR